MTRPFIIYKPKVKRVVLLFCLSPASFRDPFSTTFTCDLQDFFPRGGVCGGISAHDSATSAPRIKCSQLPSRYCLETASQRCVFKEPNLSTDFEIPSKACDFPLENGNAWSHGLTYSVFTQQPTHEYGSWQNPFTICKHLTSTLRK